MHKSADLGGILGETFGAMDGLASANEEMKEGNSYDGTSDIRSLFAGGAYVDCGGVGKCNESISIGESTSQLWQT